LAVEGRLIVLRPLHAVEGQQEHGRHLGATRCPITCY
jgi:hypothetical protein